MLKIAEGISLAELEKYGFRYYNSACKLRRRWISENGGLNIFEDDKTIVNIDGEDALYDLIQAGIVVKE